MTCGSPLDMSAFASFTFDFAFLEGVSVLTGGHRHGRTPPGVGFAPVRLSDLNLSVDTEGGIYILLLRRFGNHQASGGCHKILQLRELPLVLLVATGNVFTYAFSAWLPGTLYLGAKERFFLMTPYSRPLSNLRCTGL